MKKLMKNNNGSMILLSGIVLIIALMSVEWLFYTEPEYIDTSVVKVEKGWLGAVTGFFDMVFNGIKDLGSMLTFQSEIITQLGIFGIILGTLLWCLIVIGLIDILWIG